MTPFIIKQKLKVGKSRFATCKVSKTWEVAAQTWQVSKTWEVTAQTWQVSKTYKVTLQFTSNRHYLQNQRLA